MKQCWHTGTGMRMRTEKQVKHRLAFKAFPAFHGLAPSDPVFPHSVLLAFSSRLSPSLNSFKMDSHPVFLMKPFRNQFFSSVNSQIIFDMVAILSYARENCTVYLPFHMANFWRQGLYLNNQSEYLGTGLVPFIYPFIHFFSFLVKYLLSLQYFICLRNRKHLITFQCQCVPSAAHGVIVDTRGINELLSWFSLESSTPAYFLR